MNQMIPENELSNEETASIVYGFAAGRDFQPEQNGVVFAATNSGLLKSTDGGRTWSDALESMQLNQELPVTSLAISPTYETDGIVLAGAPGGIFRSIDAGQNWRALVFPPPPPTVSAMVISPNFAEDNKIFAGTMEDGVFTSNDGGQHWVAWNFGLLDLNVVCLGISPGFAEDETLFAGADTGLFRSTNGGRAWREIELPFGFEAVLSLALSPNYTADQTLYLGSENQGLWTSHDGGETWTQAPGIEDPVNGILFASGDLLAITSAALWRSTDGGLTWTNALPEAYTDRELSAILAPQGVQPGSRVLAGWVDGSINSFELE